MSVGPAGALGGEEHPAGRHASHSSCRSSSGNSGCFAALVGMPTAGRSALAVAVIDPDRHPHVWVDIRDSARVPLVELLDLDWHAGLELLARRVPRDRHRGCGGARTSPAQVSCAGSVPAAPPAMNPARSLGRFRPRQPWAASSLQPVQ